MRPRASTRRVPGRPALHAGPRWALQSAPDGRARSARLVQRSIRSPTALWSRGQRRRRIGTDHPAGGSRSSARPTGEPHPTAQGRARRFPCPCSVEPKRTTRTGGAQCCSGAETSLRGNRQPRTRHGACSPRHKAQAERSRAWDFTMSNPARDAEAEVVCCPAKCSPARRTATTPQRDELGHRIG